VPITPFHGGVGLLCKAPLGERFSFTVFVATQMVIDLESGYFLFTQQHPVHRFLHTFLGASFACLFVAVVLRRPCEAVLRWLADEMLPQWLDRKPEIPRTTALFSAFIGMLGHVVPDAIMHADARPFAPFAEDNPFLDAVPLGALHLGLVVCGFLGIVWMRVHSWLRSQPR
jgi:hypothetical protein